MVDNRDFKVTFHLTISMRGQRTKGKIQRNNYHHGNCGPSLTGKTMSVFLIFMHGTHLMFEHRDLVTHSSHIAFESGTSFMFQFEQ